MRRWIVVGLFLLGAVGVGLARARGVGIPQAYVPIVRGAEQTPTPTQIPSLTFDNCQGEPPPDAAPNSPIQIVSIADGRRTGVENVAFQNVTTATVDLTGWHLCSLTNNKEFVIDALNSKVLEAGVTRTFSSANPPVWERNGMNIGALYDPAGQLVSYFVQPFVFIPTITPTP